MPICAIYARVSDEMQTKGESVDHQISFMREFARRRSEESGENWLTPDDLVYRDDGITGTSMLKRPNVLQMIEDAKCKRFDIVLFKGISRFARNTVDALLMLQTLKICGVRIISFEENFDSQRDHTELIFTMHSAVAQYESEKTGIRVRIGNFEKARSGKWCGAVPEGYALDPDTKRLIPDPSRSWLIQFIFSEYLKGKGFWTIASELNRQGILTKRGAHYTAKRIREIITNRVYVGDVIYGRREQKLAFAHEQDLLTRKRRTVVTDNEANLAICTNAHTAIVSKENFQRANSLIAERRTKQGRRGREHILSKGILHCACGARMRVKVNHRDVAYYYCSHRTLPGAGKCKQKSIRAEWLEQSVLQHIRTEIMDRLQAGTYRSFLQIKNPVQILEQQLQTIQTQLEREKQKATLLLERWMEEKISEDQFAQMNQIVTGQIQGLHQTYVGTQRKLRSLKDSSDERLQDVLHTFEQLLRNSTPDKAQTRELLRNLVHSIHILERSETTIKLSIFYRFKN
ncbi:recombinase family protein [Fodinisporobacter ferrooxydans]|uniref:Recombinase family protein n=1 Tax=Fodinisporobacter ferrooxydans TaxID=2901836 RepID=A0ABY4CGY1_9BACL|nr:recombinase family protein [Alicyclobacillaceae bacterium MYW30-H2]